MEQTAAQRLVDMVLAKVKGEPFESEMIPTDVCSHTDAACAQGSFESQGDAYYRWRRYQEETLTRFKVRRPRGGVHTRSKAATISKAEDYEISHGGYDPQLVRQDPDRLVPLDAMRELEREGVIGELHDEFISTSGWPIPFPTRGAWAVRWLNG